MKLQWGNLAAAKETFPICDSILQNNVSREVVEAPSPGHIKPDWTKPGRIYINAGKTEVGTGERLCGWTNYGLMDLFCL